VFCASEIANMRIERVCRVCGRGITLRRKWAASRDEIQYCSDACRDRGLTRRDLDVEQAILELLERRSLDASICPSEVARMLFADGDWRAEMERVRMAARRLQRAGRIQVTQKGRAVDPSRARGPIRLRLRQFGAMQA
jgi:hypothetical protein